MVARCPRQNSGAAKLTIAALRSFPGFLHLEGITDRPLVCAVPSVARRRLARLPKGLEPDQARRLLASCDARTPGGCRDLAILTLPVRLGLRRGEVAGLGLDDIDWRAGTVSARGKGNCHERVPLPPDVGCRLADYLQHARVEVAGVGVEGDDQHILLRVGRGGRRTAAHHRPMDRESRKTSILRAV